MTDTFEKPMGDVSTEANAEVEKDFLKSLAEDIRGDSSLKDFKDINGLAKSYVNLSKMIGGRIALPTGQSTAEELNGFYSKLGRPESFDKYSFNPEDKSEITNKFREVAFKSGLSDKQAADIYGMFEEHAKEQLKLAEESGKKFEEKFAKEFGANIDSVKKNVNDILSKYAPEGAIDLLDKIDPESQMMLIKIFDNMAKKSNGEGVLKGGEQIASSNSIDDMIRKKIELMKDRNYLNNPDFIKLRDRIDEELLKL
jgi:hypothetical protein